jgi:hypothetical protein
MDPYSVDYSQFQTYCGPHCLYVVGRFSGYDVNYGDIALKLHPDPSKGVSISNIEQYLISHKWTYEIAKCSLQSLSKKNGSLSIVYQPPQNVTDASGHFYVARSLDGCKLQIIDPPDPPYVLIDVDNVTLVPMIFIYPKGQAHIDSSWISAMGWLVTIAIIIALNIYVFRRDSNRRRR